MAIETRLTEMFSLRYPIMLAPMGGVAGGVLAATISNAGGLGMVGGGYGNIEELERELQLAASGTTQAWGAGLITWCMDRQMLDVVLGFKPAAIMLSFGDPRPWAEPIHAAGVRLVCQVQNVDSARLAQAAGANIIVAQGTEAGGHGAQRATLPLVPAVTDAVHPVPTVAAGGIADGRGLAAALMLGAQGASIGTRFYASTEALGPDSRKRRIVEGAGDATIRTSVFDIVRGRAWPPGFTGRALNNAFVKQWHGREPQLRAGIEEQSPAYQRAEREADYDHAVVWAGESADLVGSVLPAVEILETIGREAEAALNRRDAPLRARSA